MIPSSVNIEKKALRPDIELGYKMERMALLIDVSVPSDFGLNNAEIKNMTKCPNLKKEVKISWKLKKREIVPVIIGATGMMKKNLTEILKPFLGILLETNYSRKLSGAR